MTKKTDDDAARTGGEHAETRILTPEADANATQILSDPNAPPQTSSPPDPFSTAAATGTIGDYRIIRRLGEGGMGVVYEAEQQNPRRRVALKVIRGGLGANDHVVKMFEREIEALARLKHPGIASIYESGRSEDGQLFFAMELVQGVELTDFVEKQRSLSGSVPPVNDQLQLFTQIGDVVNYAHQRGIIHRDLKPQNILVTDEGDAQMTLSGESVGVKILDFGLARINDPEFRGNTNMSEVGQIKGTLLYMSPEQVRGRPDEIDIRSDVYALGVMLYEMLSGRMPYDLSQASLPEAMRIVCEDAPLPLTRALTETYGRSARIDRDVETIVLKALEKEPDRRYQSVAAMVEDIERYLTNQPITARPPSAYYQFRKLVARHRAAFAALAVIFLMLLAFGIVMAAQSVRIASERDKAEQARGEADEQRAEAEKSRNDALQAQNEEQKQRRVAEHNLERAETEQIRAEDALKKAEEQNQFAQRSQFAEAEQRQLAERNLAEAMRQKAVAEKQTEVANEQKAFALKASQFAGEQRYIAEKNKIVAENRAEENRRQLYVSQMNLADQAWERSDISRMTELLENQIPKPGQTDLRGFEWYHLWRLGHRDLWTSPQSGMVLAQEFSPDGRTLAISKVDTDTSTTPPKSTARIVLLNTVSGKETHVIDECMLFGFLPDGRLLIRNERNQISQMDLQTMEVSPSKMGVAGMRAPILSADGTRAAYLNASGTIDLVDTMSGNSLFSLTANQGVGPFSGMFSMYSHPMRFSPDGRILAYAGNDQVRFWDVSNGQELTGLKSDTPEFYTLSFSPDGKTLATKGFDETIKLWDLATKKERAVLKSRDAQVRLGNGFPIIEFSPDGKFLASASGRAVKLWDVRSKNDLATIKAHSEIVSSISFSPDGTKLATVSPNESVKMWGIPHDDAITLPGQVSGGALSHDGKMLATAGADGLLRLWDFATYRELAAFGAPPNNSWPLAFLPKLSPDGKTVVVMRIPLPSKESMTGGGATDFVLAAAMSGFQIEFWDSTTKQKLVTLEERSLNSFAFSPDGKMYVTVNHDRVRLWNAATHEMIFSFSKAGTIAAFSSDSNVLALGSGEKIRFIDISDGKDSTSPLRVLPSVNAMTFSPDSGTFATSVGKEVVLWNFTNRKEIGRLKGHSNVVSYIAFSPDGKRVATVSQDGTAKVWDVDSKQAFITFEMGIALPIYFSPDGKALITYSNRGVHIWRGATDEEVAKQRGH